MDATEITSTQEQPPIEEQVQEDDAYYCGQCKGFVPIADPCVHHSLVR
jgi:hypothetical protein